jgi:short-subunit dehydrogenase
MRVNYLGSRLLHACSRCLIWKQTRGRLVAVSSLAGKNGVPTRSGYAASKHAMAGFFDSLRIELAETGVSVTVIYPGFVTSEIRQRAFGADGQPLVTSPVREAEVMSAEECARIDRGDGKRKREEVMTLRGSSGQWMKLIAPGAVDRWRAAPSRRANDSTACPHRIYLHTFKGHRRRLAGSAQVGGSTQRPAT